MNISRALYPPARSDDTAHGSGCDRGGIAFQVLPVSPLPQVDFRPSRSAQVSRDKRGDHGVIRGYAARASAGSHRWYH